MNDRTRRKLETTIRAVPGATVDDLMGQFKLPESDRWLVVKMKQEARR